MSYPFTLVDVFGEAPFSGNPLAVVHGAEGLDPEAMQRIARWLNLSETTFLLPPADPAADYRVRIFTPERELPFAGHPTLGSCQAWLAAGGAPRDPARMVQACGVGRVPISRVEGQLAFAAPPRIRSGPANAAEADAVVKLLRLDPSAVVEVRWVDNGPGWIAVLLGSAAAVLEVSPVGSSASSVAVGVVGPHPAGSPADFEVRGFFTDQTGAVREDPVTGSLNASLAQWLMESGRAPPSYVAAQGTVLGRRGRVTLRRDEGGQVWVAGATTIASSGDLTL